MPKTPEAEAEERRIPAEMGNKLPFPIPPHQSRITSPAPETDEDDDQEGH
jgi:hypothetical protein